MIGFYIYCGVLAGLTLAVVVACVRGVIEDNRRLTRFYEAVDQWNEPPPLGPAPGGQKPMS